MLYYSIKGNAVACFDLKLPGVQPSNSARLIITTMCYKGYVTHDVVTIEDILCLFAFLQGGKRFLRLIDFKKFHPFRKKTSCLTIYRTVCFFRVLKVRTGLRKMKKRKVQGPDDIPVEAWIALGNKSVEFLVNFLNRLLRGEKITNEWRRNVLVPLFKGKGDITECGNYRGIKLMSHTMKLWERVIKARISKKMTIAEQQFGFMPGKSTTDAIFCLRMLLEK